MIEAPLNHPDDETLRTLSLGQLPEAELARVSAHLGDCPVCCLRIDQLGTKDRFLVRLQQIVACRDEMLITPAQRRPAVRALRQSHVARSGSRKRDPEAAPVILPAARPARDFDLLAGGANIPADPVHQKSEAGDRYQLFGEIARGGMGAVLRGRDVDLGRDLAVKVLLEKHANLPEVTQRFINEARIGGQLQHPGVVPVYDIGRFGDRPFFTMKLVEGMTLAALLGEREQPTDDRPRLLSIALQVAQALAYAHAKGVIHRDLKPANVMVGAFGEVQVMDWGLAKVLDEGDVAGAERTGRQHRPTEETVIGAGRGSGSTAKSSTETEAGSILGTPAYMPPEQARGDIARLDRRADVFGLGAILCEILTGIPPHVGRTSEEVQRKAANGDLADAHARLDDCGAHPELRALTKWCLSPEAIDRPRDAQGVAVGLSKYLNGVQERLQAIERERAVALVRASEEGKRRKVQLALAAALVGLLVCGGIFAFWRHQQAQVGRERDARNAEAVAALLRQGEEALRANDAAKAAVALEAAEKRSAEGGAQELGERLRLLEADLALVRDLDAVDQFRWTVVANKFPDPALVAMRTQQALSRFGADPTTGSIDEAAARVSASVAHPRVVAALDRQLRHEKSAEVHALLRRVDADRYRDAVRDAVLAGDGAKFVGLAAMESALVQPPGFVAFLGENGAIPLERRQQLLQVAVSQQPGDVGLLMTLGHSYWNNQKLADGHLRWFQAAVAAAPGNASAHNSLGFALAGKGHVDEAIACYQKAIALDPKLTGPHLNLGSALEGKGQVDEAIARYQKVIALEPKHAKAYSNLGNARRARGQLDEAIACYQKAIALDPKLAAPQLNLGLALEDRGQVDDAIAGIRKAIDLDPKDANAHSCLGAILCDVKRDYDGAIACFQKAISLDPTYARAHSNLGNARRAKGQVDEAIVCYHTAIALDPKYAKPHTSLGAILCDVKRDYDGAIACFQKAIALDPKQAVAHHNLGVARRARGQVDEAIACFQKAIALAPKYANAHNNLGAALGGKGQMDEAIACFRKAVALAPKQATYHSYLGMALASKGQVDEAIACFQKAIALDPKFAPARFHLTRSERLAAARDKFTSFQKGTYTPATSSERLSLVAWCQVKKLHHTAAGLYVAAFAADPRLADDLEVAHRYGAACSSALAAAGQGEDAARLDDQERTRLRRQALTWLRADLALRTRQLESGKPTDRALVRGGLRHWQQDRDLASLRDAAALAKLPAEEQKACTLLWADVAALLEKAEEKANRP